jgi:DUF4097 and DUF4098 domain-containing protein YvlB
MKQVSAILFFLALVPVPAQDTQPERVTVPFSDPSRPKMLKASLLNGGITVKGYDGKDAIIESRGRGGADSRRRRPAERTDGMRRLDVSGTGLQVEESDNTITVGVGWRGLNNDTDIVIQVPYNTSVKFSTTNGGDLIVDHVTGDVELNNTNGNATATHISGSAIVHALNGKVLASLDRVTPDKPMSFSSLNGDIDVTLPGDVKARVKLKSDNGEIYSDFEVKLDASARQPVVEDHRSEQGRYKIRFDRATYGTINGGGPEVQLTTFNGNIYIRKAK